MRKTRTIVAVTLLATALCADRAVASTVGSAQIDARPVARGFAQRLSVSLRRVVPVVNLHQNRQDTLAVVCEQGTLSQTQKQMHDVEGTPFQFRLPPPIL